MGNEKQITIEQMKDILTKNIDAIFNYIQSTDLHLNNIKNENEKLKLQNEKYYLEKKYLELKSSIE